MHVEEESYEFGKTTNLRSRQTELNPSMSAGDSLSKTMNMNNKTFEGPGPVIPSSVSPDPYQIVNQKSVSPRRRTLHDKAVDY